MGGGGGGWKMPNCLAAAAGQARATASHHHAEWQRMAIMAGIGDGVDQSLPARAIPLSDPDARIACAPVAEESPFPCSETIPAHCTRRDATLRFPWTAEKVDRALARLDGLRSAAQAGSA
jgi:hypothetical protein